MLLRFNFINWTNVNYIPLHKKGVIEFDGRFIMNKNKHTFEYTRDTIIYYAKK